MEIIKMDDCDVLTKSGGQSSLNESLNGSLDSGTKVSPFNCSDDSDKKSPNISRYGRARKQKTIIDFYPTDMAVSRKLMKSPKQEKSPIRLTNKAAKMHATKSPLKPTLSPQAIKMNSLLLNGQGDYDSKANRYNYNKKSPKEMNGDTIWSQSPQKKQFKTYVRKDLIQKRRESKEETVNLMKSMFSPVKSPLNNFNVSPIASVYDKIGLNSLLSPKPNGIPENHSVVKTLDFNGDTRENKKTILDCSTFVKKNIDVELNNLNKDEEQCPWKVGELAWARVGSHPFWPCLVTRDPYSDMYLKKKTIGRSSIPSDVLHVTFFADSGRRGWILSSMMLKFEGLEQFEEMRDGVTAEMKKKDPKHYNAFTVSQGKKRKWQTAISEAELLMRRPPEMRSDFFEDMSGKETINEGKQTTPKREYKKRAKSECNGISLSESLFDSLFSSSEDSATEKVEKVRNSLDVSDVVTACLDDMATKSGNRIIQKQSHMDRWLQKAKSPQKTPSSDEASFKEEESDEKVQVCEAAEDDKEESVCNEESVKVNGVTENISDTDCAPNTNQNKVETGSNTDAEISVKEETEGRTPNRSLSLRNKKPNEEQNNSNASADVMSSESQSSSDSEEENTAKRKKDVKSNLAKYEDPDFLRYVDLRKDSLMDENPHLTENDLLEYLYKTWLYEESRKTAEMKNDDLQQSTLVKGLSDDQPIQPKKVKRRVKREKDKVKAESPGVSPKIKPVRKRIIKTYFKDDSDNSDFEAKNATVSQNKVIEKTSENTVHVNGNAHVSSEDNDRNGGSDDVQGESDEEYYLADLTKPRPNLFRGLSKEKVCEICEKAGNLVKCRGPCGSMFHVDCVKKQSEEPEVIEEPSKKSRGKKKKRVGKKLGRPKKNVDSQDESQTENLESSKLDESQNDSVEDESIIDESANEQSKSEEAEKEEVQESSSHMVANAFDFESQLELKMQEILVDDKFENCDADLDSTEDENDWDNTEAGKCEIVDVKLKSAKQDEVKYETIVEMVTCKNCLKFEKALCFVCKMELSPKSKSEKTQRCNVPHCNKYYHLDCLDAWPQTKFNSGAPSKSNRKISEHFEALTCPRHVCHTCVCDDPRGCKTRFSGDKLARCVRCPAAYHCFTQCVPAGSQVLTASQIVCPRHHEARQGKIPYHVNTSWCFICASGGTLICCDTCPTSFHAECLNISPPEDGYICEDCETGRLPLYGELVWVKLGNYRWWPGLVLYPHEAPANILSLRHSAGEFVVRFFGAHDHYWVNRGRVFPYQEGDTGHVSGKKSSVDSAFLKAVEQAQKAYTILQNEKQKWSELPDITSSLLPPHYVKLKVNKPCGALAATRRADNGDAHSLTQCDCKAADADPCGPDSDCLNRMLLTECPPTCASGERCKNRVFERRTYPSLVPYRTPHRGWGLKTLEDVRKGQFVIEYVGEIIDEAEFQRRMRRKHETRDENFYFLTLDKDRMLDAGPKGNVARFMNHSCEPNCETQKWTVNGDTRVGLFALHHIPANSEVTFNYNLECASVDKKTCACGAKRCSGYIGVKPKQEEVQKQKKLLPAKRKYKKRIPVANSPSASTATKVRKERKHNSSMIEEKAKPKTEEMTEIEKDLMIIRNATNGMLPEDESESKNEAVAEQRKENDEKMKSSLKTNKEVQSNPLKRKRVSFSSEEIIIYESVDPMLKSPHIKKIRLDSGEQDLSVLSVGEKNADTEKEVNDSTSEIDENSAVEKVEISVNGLDDSLGEKRPRGRPRKST